jgi:DNA-binding beta-propeller fold protein YncE
MIREVRALGGLGFDWRIKAAALLIGAGLAAGACTPSQQLPASGHQLFTSPQANPIALSEDGGLLFVANTTSGTLSIYDLDPLVRKGKVDPRLLAQVKVGLDPVGVAQRPGSNQVWVTNHISDSISVVDLDALDVVDTIQELDAAGVTRTDAPVGIAFASPTRAFVTLDDANQVLVIDTQPDGSNPVITSRLQLTAQAPRALAVSGDKLFVAAFESENQTEFPTCAPGDPRGLDESDPHDEGCEFASEIIDWVEVFGDPNAPGGIGVNLELGAIFDFAAVNPNIKGRIIHDRDRPDRDLFVFDAGTLALEQVVEHVGTLLYGVEAQGGRVWVTNTDARNHLEGLAALDNRMFDNRIAALDCAPLCGPVANVSLDANALGVPVPTPYGVRASADGQTLVVSVAGSDGRPGLAGDPGTDIPGLVTLDRDGAVLGQVQTGAIPQGVALLSDAGGAAQTAFVLNTVESSVSVVDVSDPASPALVGTFEVGADPTPPVVREGRIAFSSARASTRGEFSCESCHPNSNIDQVLWVINSVGGPNDDPDCNPFSEECPEPRTTMPIRGLRDTLPLHWMGNLADPFENVPNQLPQPEDHAAPDCDLSTDGEAGCARHLVNGSLSGVMCEQVPGCPIGPSGLPGALDEAERDALAEFLLAVSFPPSPARRPDDVLTPLAAQGVADFFTDEDGLGVGSPTGGGIGGQVGFAPITCADNSGGCHTLPLTAGTNSVTVGGFDAPSMRGMWDRFLLFSNGVVSSEEWLELAQACADGNPPGGHPELYVFGQLVPQDQSADLLRGDPCALQSNFFNFMLDPFPGVPSGEHVYDPAEGMTERGQFAGTFEAIFHLAYGVRAAPMWQFMNEMSVGLPGLTGRQLELDPASAGDPAVIDAMSLMEAYADEGRLTLVARNRAHAEYRFANGLWRTKRAQSPPLTPAEFRARVVQLGAVYTLTAELPANVSIAGPDRQVLLDVDPDDRAEEAIGDLLAVPEPSAAGGDTIRIGAKYADPAASVLVDGVACAPCSLTLGTAPVTGEPIADVSLPLPLTPGIHVLQLLNPDGWMSNEMPILARAEEDE